MDLSQLDQTTIVDLSVTVSERLPCFWPGAMPFAHKNWNWFAEVDGPTGRTRSVSPHQTNVIVMDEHCGTHMDGPTHFLPPEDSGLPWSSPLGSISTEQLDLAALRGPAVVVDMRTLSGQGEPGVSPFITASHIQAWEDEHSQIRPGEVVLLRTGWDRYYVEGPEGQRFTHAPLVTGSEPGWPAPDPSAMLLLHERGVRTVGIDAPSMGAAHDGAPVHHEGLSRGMLYVELLTNLGALPVRGAYFWFLPLKVEGGTGGPGRAIALLP